MKKYILFIFVAIIFLVNNNTKVHALTLVLGTWGGPSCLCEVAHQVNATISTDKSSYTPGETMNISANLDLGRDIGAIAADTAAASVSYRSGPTFDDSNTSGGYVAYVSTGQVSPDIVSGYGQSGGVSLGIPGGMSSGSHFIEMKLALATTWNRTPPVGVGQSGNRFGALTFNVAAVAVPTVQLYFSQASEKLGELLAIVVR